MKIEKFNSLPSTQLYLIDLIKRGKLSEETTVVAERQTEGIGSRGNSWIGEDGNLFISVALPKESINSSIPMQSLSIYFSMLMFEVLSDNSQDIFLKWPNDFYVDKFKVGGTVTNIVKDFVVVGIGLNTSQSSDFGVAHLTLTNDEVIENFIINIESKKSWLDIFEKYKLHFQKSREFSVHHNGEKLSLQNAQLQNDGSILLNGEIIFTSR